MPARLYFAIMCAFVAGFIIYSPVSAATINQDPSEGDIPAVGEDGLPIMPEDNGSNVIVPGTSIDLVSGADGEIVGTPLTETKKDKASKKKLANYCVKNNKSISPFGFSDHFGEGRVIRSSFEPSSCQKYAQKLIDRLSGMEAVHSLDISAHTHILTVIERPGHKYAEEQLAGLMGDSGFTHRSTQRHIPPETGENEVQKSEPITTE